MSKNPYKDILWPTSKKEEKKLDKNPEVEYSKETEEKSVKEFTPDYKTYCIIRKGPKQYILATVDIDSGTMSASNAVEGQEFESEGRALRELQARLANQAVKFRKEIK